MITYKELVDNIKEIHIINNIMYDIKALYHLKKNLKINNEIKKMNVKYNKYDNEIMIFFRQKSFEISMFCSLYTFETEGYKMKIIKKGNRQKIYKRYRNALFVMNILNNNLENIKFFTNNNHYKKQNGNYFYSKDKYEKIDI